MPQHIVFYSWQSDLPSVTNRTFIEEALKGAVDTIHSDESNDVALVIDRDTANVPGSPDIASTIFGKIDQADAFICDISLINLNVKQVIESLQRLGDDLKQQLGVDKIDMRLTPNPNVLIELGYALKALGDKKIVMLFNDAYGSLDMLPFDLKQRRVTRYSSRPGQAKPGERAGDRQKLAATLIEALQAILAGLEVPIPEEVAQQPLSLADKAIGAIESAQPNQAGLVRRYMGWLAEEITRRTPQFADEQGPNKWGDTLIAAINDSTELVIEFARLAQAISSMNSVEAADALYKGFAGVLELYNRAANASGSFRTIDFDFARFLGHELFVTFFAALIQDDRWELIGELLSEEFYVSNPNVWGAGMLPFDYLSLSVELLNYRSDQFRRPAFLNDRHTTGDLRQIVPMEQFVAADYFLNLRDRLQDPEDQDIVRWYPWSTRFMKDPPRFLVGAGRMTQARRIMKALGSEDESVEEFRSQLREVLLWHQRLFRAEHWSSPVHRFNIASFGSR